MIPRNATAAPRRLGGLLTLAGVLTALGGCGGTPNPAGAFCEQWVAAYCEGNRDCCTSVEDTYTNVDSCKSAQRARCALGAGSAFSGAPPLATFNAAEGERALADLRAAGTPGSCTEPPSLDAYTLVVGTLAIGGDCSPLGGDLSPIAACAPGSRCLLAASRTGALIGQCVRESTSGDSCVAETCEPSSYCADLGDPSAGSAGICSMRKGEGQACTSARECVAGACVSMLCGALGGPGASAWCVTGAGLSAVVPPAEDLGTDLDAGL